MASDRVGSGSEAGSPGGVSMASTNVALGSTVGRRILVRQMPESPTELNSLVNSSTPPYEFEVDTASLGAHSDDPEYMGLRPRQQHWANKAQFVLACIGYSVGLANLWRFPYLCYKSGGGVFLIPYFLILFICGAPMFYMELAVGQFTGRGPIGALGQLCPLLKGAGLAMVVISFLMSTYYSVIIAYGIYYFFTAMRPVLQWAHCDQRWNTDKCWPAVNRTRPECPTTAAEEFFERRVLDISDGIQDAGSIKWDLAACLLCAWIVVYFALWKSIKSSAKARYFTATLPFALVLVFLGRSLTLEGAELGLRYFLRPRWELLADAKVWVNAAAQNFNSIGVAFGSIISFASYNRYNNNILQDTIAVTAVNAISSLLVGFVAFAVIGNIASESGSSVEDVIADGPGLIFVLYPQALAQMPAAKVWSVLFFFMLLCLSLNSQFAIVEVVVTSIHDGFSGWVRRKLACHEMLVLAVCAVSFLLGLPHITRGGIYFFQLVDHYAASVSIMYLAFFEVVAIAWLYGTERLSRNIQDMTDQKPSLYFRFCWTFAAPVMLFCLWVFAMIDYEAPTYSNGQYHYPVWAIALGWVIAALSIVCIPAYMCYVLIRADGKTIWQKIRNALRPHIFECPKCQEHNCEHYDEDDRAHRVAPTMVYMLRNNC